MEGDKSCSLWTDFKLHQPELDACVTLYDIVFSGHVFVDGVRGLGSLSKDNDSFG